MTYLIHLKRSSNRFNQNSTPDCSPPHANIVLRQIEHIIPQPRLEMTLHLRQIEVRASPSLDKLFGIVEEVQPEIEERARDGLAVDRKVLLLEMPSAGTTDQCGQDTVGAEFVFFLALLEVDLAADGVVEVELAVDHVVPCRCVGVCIESLY